MCYPAGEFLTGDSDVLLGLFDISDGLQPQPLEFWMSREQFNYWSHTHLTVDVVPGRGSGFSVEAPEGKRFLIRSTLMELARLTRPPARAGAARGAAGPRRLRPGLCLTMWDKSGRPVDGLYDR